MSIGRIKILGMTKPVISFEKVDFAYNSELILKDVSFSIHKGQFVSVIGPNGGGKTTLLKLILGQLKPLAGNISLSEKLAYVPQYQTFDSDFPTSVYNAVLTGILHKNLFRYSSEDKKTALKSLELVGLSEYKHRPLSSLSGGQKQRVLIARALTSQAEIIILDEPLANVDREVGKKIYEILKEISREKTILLVSHDVGVVTDISDRVLCVNRSVYAHEADALTGESLKRIYSNAALVRHNH